MPLDPLSYLDAALGDLKVVTILGQSYDLGREVAIPANCDFEEELQDHVVKVAAWTRLRAACRKARAKARDDLDEWLARTFVHYYAECERSERAEMQKALHDEGEDPSPFKARSRAADRVALGISAYRWRRNFSDDFVRSLVNQEEKTVALRRAVRTTTNDAEIADAVCEALDHRQKSLQHLVALHRDDSRR